MERKADKSTSIQAEFCRLIRRLHSAPASSASLEHIFCTFGHVWSKQRNRLGPDKAEKLVKAYRYLHHDIDEPDWQTSLAGMTVMTRLKIIAMCSIHAKILTINWS